MAIHRNIPPWDYLHQASIPSLESYELSRLNHAANARREIGALIEQWVEDMAHALLAQWVREDRSLTPQVTTLPNKFTKQEELPFREPASNGQTLAGIAAPVRFAHRSRAIVRS
jgi:hypothetical protein